MQFFKHQQKQACDAYQNPQKQSTFTQNSSTSTSQHPLYVIFTLMMLSSSLIQIMNTTGSKTKDNKGNHKPYKQLQTGSSVTLPWIKPSTDMVAAPASQFINATSNETLSLTQSNILLTSNNLTISQETFNSPLATPFIINITPHREAWRTPTIKVSDALLQDVTDIILSSGKKINTTLLEYSILKQHVVIRGVDELAELQLLTNDLPKNLAAFRPERLALHEIVVAVLNRIQCPSADGLNNEELMQQTVKKIYVELKPQIEIEAIKLYQLREKLHKKINILVHRVVTNSTLTDDKKSVYYADIKDMYHKLIQLKFKLGKHIPGYTIQDAISARLTDIHYSRYASPRIEELVNQHLDKLIMEGKLKPYAIPSPDKRVTFIVSGGPASGKGSVVSQIQSSPPLSDIPWDNIAKFNTDSLKPILLDPTTVEPELYSQLAQEEASLVNAKAQNKLKKLALAGKAPHAIFDQVFVGPDQLEIAKLNNGKSYVTVVSTDVINAVERSYLRGMLTGRFEHTFGILSLHKYMTIQFPNRLPELMNQNVSIQIVDNNVPKGLEPVLIADINCFNNTVIIYNEAKLIHFIQKIAINPYASSQDEVYERKNTSIDQYFENTKYHFVHYAIKIDIETKPKLSPDESQLTTPLFNNRLH